MSPIRKQRKLHENQYRLKPFWPTTWSLCTTVPKLSLQTRYILLRVSFILAYFIAICIVRIITDGGTKCQKLPLPSPWPLFCIDLALCSSVCYYLHYLLHYYFNIGISLIELFTRCLQSHITGNILYLFLFPGLLDIRC